MGVLIQIGDLIFILRVGFGISITRSSLWIERREHVQSPSIDLNQLG